MSPMDGCELGSGGGCGDDCCAGGEGGSGGAGGALNTLQDRLRGSFFFGPVDGLMMIGLVAPSGTWLTS